LLTRTQPARSKTQYLFVSAAQGHGKQQQDGTRDDQLDCGCDLDPGICFSFLTRQRCPAHMHYAVELTAVGNPTVTSRYCIGEIHCGTGNPYMG